jgi:hypothetical protein
VAETHKNKTDNTFNHMKKVKEVQAFFPEGVLTLENYRWAAAILDSRSIWWDGVRHLVPMLDFINCKEGPDPRKVHSTIMDSQGSMKVAVTKAGWNFKKNEQLYENYGQANHIYFTHHGFSLGQGENSHDCVHFEVNLSEKEISEIDWNSEGVRRLSQAIGLRNRAVYTTCLKQNIPQGLWLFLSLKTMKQNNAVMNKDRDTKGFGSLSDKPTQESRQLLLVLIDDRIKAYDRYVADGFITEEGKDLDGDRHEASRIFLNNEHLLLKSISKSLKEDFESYEYDEL